MSPKKVSMATLATLITLGVNTASAPALAEDAAMEKCYGIVKKGMNDCAGTNHPCQGQANTDSESDSWIYVPKGTCDKIVTCKTK